MTVIRVMETVCIFYSAGYCHAETRESEECPNDYNTALRISQCPDAKPFVLDLIKGGEWIAKV